MKSMRTEQRGTPIAVALLFLAAVACGDKPADRREEIYDLKTEATPANVERIRELLDDEDGTVRAYAVHALVEIGVPDATTLALEALSDRDSYTRRIAARALEDLGDPAAVPALGRTVVEDEDYRVREWAADALAAIGTDDAISELTRALEDPVKEVRLAAVKGIVKRRPEAAVDSLVSMVLEDPEWEIRVQAAAALGKIDREDVLPALEEAANDPNEFVRAAVASALRLDEP
jgi:HEAT repeat protein